MNIFKRNQDGSVSIFLISIVAAVFFFNAVLIDFARIYAAKRQSDLAVQAAVRSVMSTFDKDLQRKYGLFGFDEKEMTALFEDIVNENLTGSSSSGFTLIAPELTSGSVDLQGTGDLGNQVVFQQQILEDVKYKAPIELTLEMFDKFKKIAKVMKSASAATKASREMKKQYEKREKNFEEYWKNRDRLSEQNTQLGQLVNGNRATFDLSDRNSNVTQINDIENIANHFDYVRMRYSEMQEWERQKIALEQEIANLKSDQERLRAEIAAMQASRQPGQEINTDGISSQIERLGERISKLIDDKTTLETKIRDTKGPVNQYLSQSQQVLANTSKKIDDMMKEATEAENNLQAAKEANRSMKAALDKAKQDTNETNYNNVGDAPDTPGNPANDANLQDTEQSLEQLVKDMEKMVLPDEFFQKIEQQINDEKARLTIIKGIAEELKSALPAQYDFNKTPPGTSTVKSYANEIYSSYKNVNTDIQAHSNPSNYPEEVERREAKEKYDQGQKKVNNDQFEADPAQPQKPSLKEALAVIAAMKLMTGSAEDYKQLNEYYLAYMNQQAEDASKGIEVKEDMEESTEDAMSIMDGLFENMANFFESMRNEMYVNEYAMQRFKYYDPTSVQYWLKPPIDFTNLEENLSKVVSVKGSEIEYITYGLHSPGANIGAAFGELFLFRLALRTLEGFADPRVKSMGHPLLILVAAIIYGVTRAVLDMYKFFMGEEVELISFPVLREIKLKYKDYLRLFLLIHSNETKKLARMQALIQFNTKKDLSGYQSYVSGNAQFSVRLWFLPGVMAAVNKTAQLNGSIQGNKYIFQIGQRDMSY